MEEILNLITQHDWYKIYKEYKPEEIINRLSFKQGMSLAYQMLINEQGDDDLREYSVKLFENIRQIYPDEWNSDWKNELLLGDAYYFIMNFDEQCKAYERSAKMIDPLPPALLVSLAGCYIQPGNPSNEAVLKAEKMLQEALKQEESVEAVIQMRSICKIKGDQKQFTFLSKLFEELEAKKAYIKNKLPEILKPEFKE